VLNEGGEIRRGEEKREIKLSVKKIREEREL